MTQKTKTDIWMPLYIGDYLADTSRLSTEQHGAYLLLLMDYWRNGPLPNDSVLLAQITRMTVDAWSIAQAVLMKFFFVGEDGMLHNKRTDEEKSSAGVRKEKNELRAKKAAEARWSNAPSNAPSSTDALLEECPSSSSSSSPINTKTTTAPSASKVQKPEIFELPDWIDSDTWQGYLDVRHAKRAAKTPRAWNAVVKQLDSFRAEGYEPNSILETSIRGNWTDVYRPKEPPPKPKPVYVVMTDEEAAEQWNRDFGLVANG